MIQLNHYTPKFSEVSLKLNWCQQFGLQQIFVASKRPFSCIFFGINPFSRSNSQLLSIAWHTLQIRKANVVRVHLRYRGALLVHSIYIWGFKILLENFTSISTISETVSYLIHQKVKIWWVVTNPSLTDNMILSYSATSCCQLWQLLHAVASFDCWRLLWQLLQAVASFDSCYKLLPALTAIISCC